MSYISQLRRKRSTDGFTLVEVLVVMAIIGILMGLLLGAMNFAMNRARRANTSAEMEKIAKELNEYWIKNGLFPPNEEVVKAYIELRKPEGVDWSDAWGRPYSYERTTKQTYSLTSKGANENNSADDLTLGKTH